MLLDNLILDLVKLLKYELFEFLLFVVQGDQLLSFSLIYRDSLIEIVILQEPPLHLISEPFE